MSRHLDRISQHSFIASAIDRESIVFDFGANRGEFSQQMIDKYGCRVYAAEPVDELFRGLPIHRRLTSHRIAIGENEKRVKLLVNSHDILSSTMLAHDTAQSVLGSQDALEEREEPCVGLAAFRALNQVDRVHLVKVDIEGAELDLFESESDDSLLACDQISVEFHDFWYRELSQRTEAVKARLTQLGFRAIRFTPQNNKDVLFVNPERVDLTPFDWAVLENFTRHVNFVGRGARVMLRKLLPDLGRRQAG